MNQNQVKADLESAEKDIREILDNLYVKYGLIPYVSGGLHVESVNVEGIPARLSYSINIDLSTK